MYIVKFGGSFKYTIPGFTIITVQLRHAKAQKISGEGDVKLFDVFFNEETAIEMHPPTCVEVIESSFVEVKCYYVSFSNLGIEPDTRSFKLICS